MRLDTGGGGVGGGDYGWSFIALDDGISFSVTRWSLVPGGKGMKEGS